MFYLNNRPQIFTLEEFLFNIFQLQLNLTIIILLFYQETKTDENHINLKVVGAVS